MGIEVECPSVGSVRRGGENEGGSLEASVRFDSKPCPSAVNKLREIVHRNIPTSPQYSINLGRNALNALESSCEARSVGALEVGKMEIIPSCLNNQLVPNHAHQL